MRNPSASFVSNFEHSLLHVYSCTGVVWKEPSLKDKGLSFPMMNDLLSSSTGLGRLFVYQRLKTLGDSTNVFAQQEGVYLIHAFWYHVSYFQ